LRGYLAQPYAFHLQRNSAQLIRNSLNGVEAFTEYGLVAGQKYVAELLVLCGISLLLLVVEPLVSLLTIPVVVLLGWLFHRVSRERQRRWGDARQHYEVRRLQDLQQALGAVKEIKLLGREAGFADRFQNDNIEVARAAQHHHTLIQFPRIALEVLAVFAMVLLAVVLLAQGREPNTLLPVVALFGAAAFRLIPSVNRAAMALQELRYGSASVHRLRAEVTDVCVVGDASPPRFDVAFTDGLTLDHVTYTYPGGVAPALRDVSFAMTARETIGIVGASGAGKSTLVDVILGLIAPTNGRILVDGRDIQSSLRSWQNCIGYVPQEIYLADDTIRSNIAFGIERSAVVDAQVWAALKAARLEDFVRTLPHGLDSTVGERGVSLSGGERQRIGIARALYNNPGFLVLDEATSSLDAETERAVLAALNDLHGSRAILIVAHRSSTIAHAHRIYRMTEGGIVEVGRKQHLVTAPIAVETTP
jgi:ABC-type multidrug transport system fused ATPase/permease subunit